MYYVTSMTTPLRRKFKTEHKTKNPKSSTSTQSYRTVDKAPNFHVDYLMQHHCIPAQLFGHFARYCLTRPLSFVEVCGVHIKAQNPELVNSEFAANTSVVVAKLNGWGHNTGTSIINHKLLCRRGKFLFFDVV